MQLLIAVSAIVLTIIGGYWGLGKMILRGLDTRFAGLETARKEDREQMEARLGRTEERLAENEKLLHAVLRELPRDYTRREDFLREIGSLAVRFENLALSVDRSLKDHSGEIRDLFKGITRA